MDGQLHIFGHAQPIGNIETVETLKNRWVFRPVLSCARLQRNVQGVGIVLSSIKMGVQEVDVEVPGVGVEVVVPDLYSEHERLAGHGGDGVGDRVVCAGGGEAGVDDDLVEGVDHPAVEGDQQQDDDAGGQDSPEESPVFGFLTVPQQFGSVKEVQLVDHALHIAQKTHFVLNIINTRIYHAKQLQLPI